MHLSFQREIQTGLQGWEGAPYILVAKGPRGWDKCCSGFYIVTRVIPPELLRMYE